jgi:hypothetical protein
MGQRALSLQGLSALFGVLWLVGCSSSGGSGGAATGGTGGGSSTGGSGGQSSSAGSSAAGANALGGSSAAGSGTVTDPNACKNLDLSVGATGPHGTVPLFKTSSILDDLSVLGLVGTDVYFVNNGQLEHIPSAGGAPVTVGKILSTDAVLSGSTVIWFEPPKAPATTLRILSTPASDVSNPKVVAEGISQPQDFAADADTVFFDSRSPDNIFSVPIAGGTPKNLVPGSSPLGMISDGTSLYWLDFDSSQLESVPKTGGTPQRLVDVFFGGPMALEGSTIYWADTSLNTINRWTTGDTMATQLATTGDFFEQPNSILVNSGVVYWTQGQFCNTLWQLPNQGQAGLVLSGFQSGSVFAADSTHVYVVAGDGIYRVDR